MTAPLFPDATAVNEADGVDAGRLMNINPSVLGRN